MGPLFKLPDDVILTPLLQSFPGRDHQIRSLASLLHVRCLFTDELQSFKLLTRRGCQPDAIPCRNLVLYGTEATGKSAITAQLLADLSSHLDGALSHAIVNAAQCITARHLFERIVGAVADALKWEDGVGSARGRRCETLAQLAVELSVMLKYPERDPRWRFVLVLDAVDRQRDAPTTLLPALARLSEIVRFVG